MQNPKSKTLTVIIVRVFPCGLPKTRWLVCGSRFVFHDGNPLISNKKGEGGESCGGEGGSPNHDGNPLISNCFSNVKKNGVRIEISTSKELPGEVVVF
jgi:hypothetical protein